MHLQEPQLPKEDATCSRSHELEVEKIIVFTLGLLAIKPEHQQLIVDAGALPHLVALLKKHKDGQNSRAVNGATKKASDAITNIAHENGRIKTLVSILSTEFLRASINDAGDKDVAIFSKAKARISSTRNGEDNEVHLYQEDTSSSHDRLLPLIIGLLRTAKLPIVLRIYRDTVTSDMKTAIKSVVAELLPVLLARPSDSDFKSTDRIVDSDGGSSLASKLRSLYSESFVQLLGTIFKIVQAHLLRAAEVKKAIEWIMSNLDGHYAADSVAAAIAHGALTLEITYVSDGSFPLTTQRKAVKVSPSSSNLSKNFRAGVLRENTEAVFF